MAQGCGFGWGNTPKLFLHFLRSEHGSGSEFGRKGGRTPRRWTGLFVVGVECGETEGRLCTWGKLESGLEGPNDSALHSLVVGGLVRWILGGDGFCAR